MQIMKVSSEGLRDLSRVIDVIGGPRDSRLSACNSSYILLWLLQRVGKDIRERRKTWQ